MSITVNVDNQTPTPTTRDITGLVKARLGMTPGDSSQDAQLVLLADAALAKYGELAPNIKRQTLTSQNGSLSYPLNPDVRRVLDVALPSQYGYYNDWLFLPMIDTPASSLFGYSDYAFRHPSERIVRQGILTELDHYAQSYTGYYVDGSPPVLYVLPTSTSSGLPIIVRYAADYQNTGDMMTTFVCTTLPAGHWRYIVDLIKWALMDARADKLVPTMAFTAAQSYTEGNTLLTEAWKLSNRADRILAEVSRRLGADVGVAVRS